MPFRVVADVGGRRDVLEYRHNRLSGDAIHAHASQARDKERVANCPDLICVGTDDGDVQITRDGGKTWTNLTVNITGLPKNPWVSYIDASHFAEGTAYATFDMHTSGDMRPYAYRTTDYGKTWTAIVTPNSNVRGYAHVIREDLQNRNLLFLGTESGLWISLDGGSQWAQYKGGDMPNVAVRDLAIHPRDNDLVIARSTPAARRCAGRTCAPRSYR